MKLTVEIPNTLLRRARAQAAKFGQTLGKLVSEALEDTLKGKAGTAHPREPGWMRGFGKLRHLSKETARIQQQLEAVFELIEPEDRA